MISIWTRTVTVKKTGKTFVFAFSDFLDDTCKNHKPMDDCAISVAEWDGRGNLKEFCREVAEMYRDFHGYGGFLYGGMKERPSGHRKFTMTDMRKDGHA